MHVNAHVQQAYKGHLLLLLTCLNFGRNGYQHLFGISEECWVGFGE